MNGDMQSALPIVTFAGLSNLSNILRELPLPSSIEPRGRNKSLLFDPRVADDARRVLANADPNIISQMAHVLRQTTADYIQLKDGYMDDPICGEVPVIVQALLTQYPDVFSSSQRPLALQTGYNQQHFPPYMQQSIPAQPHIGSAYTHNAQYPVANAHAVSRYGQPVALPQSTQSPATYVSMTYGLPNGGASQAPSMPPSNVYHHVAAEGQFYGQSENSSFAHSDPITQALPIASNQQTYSVLNSSHPDVDPAVESDREPVVALQSLTAEDISKYMDSHDSKPSASVKLQESSAASEAQVQPNSAPSLRLKKLEISSSHYAVADVHSSGGLKLKIKKSDGSTRIREKRQLSDEIVDDSDEAPRKKKKKHKHHKEHKSLRKKEDGSTTDGEQAYNIKQFIAVMDSILESCSLEETTGLATDLDENDGVSPDVLVNRSLLIELANEAAKLKDANVTKDISVDKLGKLMTILQLNVKDGAKLPIFLSQTDDDDDKDVEFWRDLTLDRVQRCLEAAISALYIMTSPNMPKVVYLEDLIELICDTIKFQLSSSIYPEYDPVYSTSKDKVDYTSNRMKRSRVSGGVKHKALSLMYNKLCDLLNNLTELVSMQQLTDTVILKVSALGIQPFFVENVSELQLAAIQLVTEVFSRYDKHRQLILEDIFSSLARLPTSKRNLRTYRLNHDEHIQMVTALFLQLIQCLVKLPEHKNAKEEIEDDAADDILIVTSYEQAMKTAHHFLSVFLKKCAQKGEEDFRPLFDNFVNDLLITANKPEWPAAELMLSLLGRLLVQQFSNKQVDMALRVASLDYLGTVAACLRKDAIATDQTDVDEIMQTLDEEAETSDGEDKPQSTVSERLELALLEYLLVNGRKEPSFLNARNFHIAQWYRDIALQAERSAGKQPDRDDEITEMDRTNVMQAAAEGKKRVLMEQALVHVASFRRAARLSYSSATAVTKFLTSQRPFAQSFDVYMAQILKVLSETAVAVRTKAIKCLTQVVEADASVLARTDLQKAVHARLLDQSTSVREACVELIGKFILSKPDLITHYYDMLVERILDTGISVRKRVIKIFRDVCLEMPNFDKIPDMCVKMIRRVNDEDGIKKLVSEVFQSMWFTPVRDKDTEKLMRRVLNITTVVNVIRDSSYEFIEHLMKHLLSKENESSSKPTEVACKQIVDCLVMNVLKLEQKAVEISDGKVATSRDLVSSLATLLLFSRVRPDLMTDHADTLQPYLEIKCNSPADNMVLHHTARILELVIPLIEHPREAFLTQVEEDLMTLILRQGMTVLQSSISCLGAVVNKVTHNYALVRDCFKKFQNIVFNCHKEHQADPNSAALQSRKPALRRSLFTVGVLCRHFDFDMDAFDMKTHVGKSIEELVFEQVMYFVWHEEEAVRQQALSALGFYCIRYYECMLGTRVKDLYHRLLVGNDVSTDTRVQVLNNLGKYLQEEEEKTLKAEEEWKKHAQKEDLKEMGDVQSGMASTIMQVYLKQVLEGYFNAQIQVRLAASSVVHLILKQGLVHPVQCVPYLIAMSTDCDSSIRLIADQHLQEIDKKYPGFVHMKAMAGMKLSYRLHRLVQQDIYQPLRGIRNEDNPQALNHNLYSIIRSNRGYRRTLLQSLLNLFDDTTKTMLGEQLYMADNLAFFPYQSADEPLFICHHIDLLVSVSGSNLLQSFREGLHGANKPVTESLAHIDTEESNVLPPQVHLFDEDEEDFETLFKKIPEDCIALQECMVTAQGCILLLQVKQLLKELYGINDSKLNKYSPNETQKVWERPLNRKVGIRFNPSQALELLRLGSPKLDVLDDAGKRQIIGQYLSFKQLMMKIDPADEEEENKHALNASPTQNALGEDYDNPNHPGYADPNQEIASIPVGEIDTIAASMQPTVSLVPMSDAHMDIPVQHATPQRQKPKSRSSKSGSVKKKKIKKCSADPGSDDSADDPDY